MPQPVAKRAFNPRTRRPSALCGRGPLGEGGQCRHPREGGEPGRATPAPRCRGERNRPPGRAGRDTGARRRQDRTFQIMCRLGRR